MTTVRVTEFGAIGDGRADDTQAIQEAIDSCHQGGGGRVVIPAGGTYRSGTIELRSWVELHLEVGSTLQASADDAAYTVRRPTGGLSDGRPEHDHELSTMLITADGCEQMSITGLGTIDGGGRYFVESDLGPIYAMRHVRPYTIFLVDCEQIQIRDVQIRDAAYWTIRLSGCRGVLVDAVTIRNDLKLPNSDGIDLDTCQRVRVTNCDIVTADDAICLKTCQESDQFGSCEDITISGCTLVSRSTGIGVGSEIARPIRNCLISSCVVSASHRGVGFKLSEAGGVSNMIFTNLIIQTQFFDSRFWGHGEPIYLSSYPWRGQSGWARNIRFHNIVARSENGVLIRAEEPERISDVVLSEVRIEIDRWSGMLGGAWDLRPHPANGLIEHPTHGIHLERLSNVRISDCAVVWGQASYRRSADLDQALSVVDVDDLQVRDFRGEPAHRLP